MKCSYLAFALVTALTSVNLRAGPVEDLSGTLTGRAGTSSEDRREDIKGLFDSKIGCRGDTVEAHVRITGVSGRLENDTAIMTVTYDGNYSRQGWEFPCQKVSVHLRGLEEKRVSGEFTFRVTGKPFAKPTITWGGGSKYKEVDDSGHDSNVMAIRAVQNAIASAY